MASESEVNGANNNERLLAAARTDNLELLLEVFQAGGFDINHQDGLGNTALHLAAGHESVDVLEHLLSQDGCDVDLLTRIEKATPLHLAVKLENPETRLHIVQSLLEAGADTMVKDKYGDTVLNVAKDAATRDLILRARAQGSVAKGDIASDDDDFSDSGSE